MPKISLVVPVYKVEEYLSRCVDSILAQTFADFELILVDDGSPDRCGELCDAYAEKDGRVRVIHKENGGLSSARNKGIDLVMNEGKTQWIGFVDSDDWVHPRYLEALYNAVAETDADIAVCDFVRTDKALPFVGELAAVELCTAEDFYLEHQTNRATAWAKLYKCSLFKGIRYPDGKLHEDEYTTYKLLFATERVAVIPTPLYFYFINPNGIIGDGRSISRIQCLDAFQERLVFLKLHGFDRAYKHTVLIYMSNLAYMYGIAVDAVIPSGKRKLLRDLRRRMRKLIRLSKKCGVWHGGIRDNLGFYYVAHPSLKRLVRFAMTIKRRLRSGIKPKR